MRLRIVSYNIHSCRGMDGRTDPARIATVIRALDADIVALQEVSKRPDHESDLQQLLHLAELTGLHCSAGTTLHHPDAPCGIALLTRAPVQVMRHHDLSIGEREPRGALEVDLNVAGWPVRVVNVHLGLGYRERQRQVTQLLTHLTAVPDGLTLLLGDLNEWWPLAGSLRQLDQWFGPQPALRTFPAPWPLIALDRCWVRSAQPVQVTLAAHATALSRRASDHLPLCVDIDLIHPTAVRANTSC